MNIKYLMLSLIISTSYFHLNAQSFTDARDNKSYSYTKVNNIYWFTENLNHKLNESWCYNDQESNASLHGRLYTFEVAKEVCPNGWRLPTADEIIGRTSNGNIWNNHAKKLNPSFSGYRRTKNGGEFRGQSERFAIWGEDEGNGVMATNYQGSDRFDCDFVSGGFGLSVRCVADQIPTKSKNDNLSFADKKNAKVIEYLKAFKLNKESVSKEMIAYDGVYAKLGDQYYELKENEMYKHHFIFPNEGYKNRYSFFGKYPRVFYTRTANRTSMKDLPKTFVLKGSQFTDENMVTLTVNPLEIVKLSSNQYFHSGGSSWYEEGYGFLPKWDRNEEEYETVNFKKKKIGEGHYEILIVGDFGSSNSFVITCKDKIWIFSNNDHLNN